MIGRTMQIFLFLVCFLASGWYLNAQKTVPFSSSPEKNDVRTGNDAFKKGNYADAEAEYKKALDKKNNMPEAGFNLGDAVYKQKRFEEAEKQFQLIAQNNTNPTLKAKAYHNLGNTFLEQQKWKEAVDAYKNALKNNATDAETKYNLAYANAKLKAEQNGGGGNDNKNQQEKKQEKNEPQNKNKNNEGDQKDQQQSEPKDQNGDQKKEGQQPRLSKQEAEKLLQVIENEEQKTNQKMQQKTVKGQVIKVEKDW